MCHDSLDIKQRLSTNSAVDSSLRKHFHLIDSDSDYVIKIPDYHLSKWHAIVAFRNATYV